VEADPRLGRELMSRLGVRLTGALVALLAIAGLGAASSSSAGITAATGDPPPHIKHIFVIVLENEGFDSTFGPNSEAPYLANNLRRRGELLPNYYGIGHFSLPNYIAMVSGQGPNPQTQIDCQFFTEFRPGTPTSDGQYIGNGCVYPNGVETVANQLEDAGYEWREYAQDMVVGSGPETTCRHPDINSRDETQSAEKGDQYAARHNPFVYFHAIIDFDTCDENVVGLERNFSRDLRHGRTTPNYSFITPNLCMDGHDEPCVNGKPGGLASANEFLKRKIPRILHSPAYKDRGLIIVTFDEAEASGGEADARACCNEQPGPNTINPGGPVPGPGGGRTGTILISPCIKPGSVDRHPYNHYSMLRTVENNFRLPHLGFAGQAGLKPFGATAFNRPGCGER